MLISKTYLLFPSQDIAKVYVTTNDDIEVVNLVSGYQQHIYLLHQQEEIMDFIDGMFIDWIEFELESSILLSFDSIYDQININLN